MMVARRSHKSLDCISDNELALVSNEGKLRADTLGEGAGEEWDFEREIGKTESAGEGHGAVKVASQMGE
jgi:hypothetical protein